MKKIIYSFSIILILFFISGCGNSNIVENTNIANEPDIQSRTHFSYSGLKLKITNDNRYINFQFDKTGFHSQIYIDIDKSRTSGYTVFGRSGVGADYLIENRRVYRYTGSGGYNWSWKLIGRISSNLLTTSPYSVKLPFDYFGKNKNTFDAQAATLSANWSLVLKSAKVSFSKKENKPKPVPNPKPIAKDDLITIYENSSKKLNVLANDKYFDKTKLKLKIIQKPKYGEIDKNFVYKPSLNYNGYDELTYQITDHYNNSSKAKVYITVYKDADSKAPIVQLPKTSIQPHELAIIANNNDPVSIETAKYYAQKRSIPNKNIIYVSIPNNSDTLSPKQFAPIIKKVKNALPDGIQAYALTWIKPFRVGGMSITSAFAFGGYDDMYANTSGKVCSPTKNSPYFRSDSTKPFDDHGIRPTMVLAGVNEEDIKALIDRGVASDFTFPNGTGYFIKTTDLTRSVRAWDFMKTANKTSRSSNTDLDLIYIDSSKNASTNTLKNQNDVLFYLTGLSSVANINTNDYLPGAIADHLTSHGGNLTATPKKGQMSAVRWIEAGVTGSYGTVREPCAYIGKFPQASVLVPTYFRGNTLIEAYWKSVQSPGEGIFIGEPLAKPWGRSFLEYRNGDLIIQTTWLKVYKKYSVIASNKIDGNFVTVVQNITTDEQKMNKIIVPNANYKFYKLIEQE